MDDQTKLSLVHSRSCASYDKRQGGKGRREGGKRDSKASASPIQGSCTNNFLQFFCLLKGCQTVLSPTTSEPDTTLTKTSPKNSLKGDKDPGEESEAVDGKLSIFIHKREDQSSHEVLQPLLR